MWQKTEFIVIRTKPMCNNIEDYPIKITIDDKPIKQVANYKALGVIIDIYRGKRTLNTYVRKYHRVIYIS